MRKNRNYRRTTVKDEFYTVVTNDKKQTWLFSTNSTDDASKKEVNEWFKNNPDMTLKKSQHDVSANCILLKLTRV